MSRKFCPNPGRLPELSLNVGICSKTELRLDRISIADWDLLSLDECERYFPSSEPMRSLGIKLILFSKTGPKTFLCNLMANATSRLFSSSSSFLEPHEPSRSLPIPHPLRT